MHHRPETINPPPLFSTNVSQPFSSLKGHATPFYHFANFHTKAGRASRRRGETITRCGGRAEEPFQALLPRGFHESASAIASVGRGICNPIICIFPALITLTKLRPALRLVEERLAVLPEPSSTEILLSSRFRFIFSLNCSTRLLCPLFFLSNRMSIDLFLRDIRFFFFF